jgi:hypothetical protein
MPRAEASDHVHFLTYRLRTVQSQLETPLVTEIIIEPGKVEVETEVDVVGALYALFAKGEPVYRPATTYAPRHKGSRENLEAFILADRAAAGIAAAYEMTQGQPVDPDDQNTLAAALADFRLRDRHLPASTQQPRHARSA